MDTDSSAIASGVRTLSEAKATAILSDSCTDAMRRVEGIGLTCSTRNLGPAFSDIVDAEFHPEGVIYGHFLSADSEDAVVSGWSAETHPFFVERHIAADEEQGNVETAVVQECGPCTFMRQGRHAKWSGSPILRGGKCWHGGDVPLLKPAQAILAQGSVRR